MFPRQLRRPARTRMLHMAYAAQCFSQTLQAPWTMVDQAIGYAVVAA